MAKKDNDLFERLRRVGVRKQVAKTLSEIGEGASKRALRAGRSAVSELRALADEIEGRLPTATRGAAAASDTARPASTRSPATRRRTSPARATRTPRTATRTPRTTSRSARAAAPSSRASSPRSAASTRAKPAAATKRSAAPAPRGQNKAKILESLKAGPQTASQIAGRTGIATGTVSSTLTKMAKAGEVVKADRGYGLPG